MRKEGDGGVGGSLVRLVTRQFTESHRPIN